LPCLFYDTPYVYDSVVPLLCSSLDNNQNSCKFGCFRSLLTLLVDLAGKRPRDLINPKAVKYMQEVFTIKDAFSKKESRDISVQFGATVTQVIFPSFMFKFGSVRNSHINFLPTLFFITLACMYMNLETHMQLY